MLTVMIVGIRMLKAAGLYEVNQWLRFSHLAFFTLSGVALAIYVVENHALWPEPSTPLELEGLVLTQSDTDSALAWLPEEAPAAEMGDIPPELYPERMESPEPFVIVLTGLPLETAKQPAAPDASPKATLNLVSSSTGEEEKTAAPVQAKTLAQAKSKAIPVNGVKHKIRKGESLWDISQDYGVNYKKVVMYNPSINAKRMMPGDELFIPGAKTASLKPANASSMILPVANAKLGSEFGLRKHPIGGGVRFHHGVDLPAPSGTPIRAAMGGVVTYADWRGKSMGRVVVLKHDDGLETVYAHCRVIHVRTGQRIEQGQMIAEVGRTGYTTGSHLHFEVLKDRQNQDPLKYLPRIGLSGPESRLARGIDD
ncbi:MAG: peptidoglycan DD-metalloendopeptidase family protein [bacterium]